MFYSQLISILFLPVYLLCLCMWAIGLINSYFMSRLNFWYLFFLVRRSARLCCAASSLLKVINLSAWVILYAVREKASTYSKHKESQGRSSCRQWREVWKDWELFWSTVWVLASDPGGVLMPYNSTLTWLLNTTCSISDCRWFLFCFCRLLLFCPNLEDRCVLNIRIITSFGLNKEQ